MGIPRLCQFIALLNFQQYFYPDFTSRCFSYTRYTIDNYDVKYLDKPGETKL